MQVEFQIFRQLPPDPPRLQSFWLETSPGATILDCLNQIKWEQDGSLAFRKNCRNAICGSCAVRINGRAALACRQHVEEELQPHSPHPACITLGPLGNLPVVRDLVVDMQPFWNDLSRVDPFVSTAGRRIPEREFLQSPAEREHLNAASSCILCGACYSDCNAKEVNPEFVGPHALAKANRLVQDSRDNRHKERLQAQDSTAGVWGCTRCWNCNSVCPMGVAPLDRITELKQGILASYPNQGGTGAESVAIRHRKTLVQLVRSGGWIDERRFGLQVVANQGRDPKGLLSLAPLGLRMLSKGKFPFRFKASSGTATVRRLIDEVRQQTTATEQATEQEKHSYQSNSGLTH
ncbi:MAG: succinate dehydrogenase/fumarate reductase iron-sulfur subunit [Thermostichus sp. DG_1_6_bins_120]